MTGSELELEQNYLDRAHDCLAAMQKKADEIAAITDRAVRDENTVDARIARFHMGRRQQALAQGSGPLCFGRIDTEDNERFYVGRRHVEDENSDAVVVDWRAPVSAPFYRATHVDPCGLEFRRRFIVEDKQLVDLLDEDLTDPESGGHGGLPDPLLAELERSRTGRMKDIISTIAGEQDEIIRAPIEELLVVQGGPGTGKTAVGLHRAAFLLFEHREALTESRVLVVGPNPTFLRYISDVLPSLGEAAVTQATLTGLVSARWRVRATEPDPVGKLKGQQVMADIVANAARARIKPLSEGLDLRAGLARVRLSAEDLNDLLQTALARRLPLNKARDVFRQIVIRHGWQRHQDRPGVDPASEPLFSSQIRSDPAFKAAIDKMWPTLLPANIVRDLWGSPKRLSEASLGLLDPAERSQLRRPKARKVADEMWTAADIAVLDEAHRICVGVPATYGHVVVDEAQDVTAMGLRMLARRANRGSMTVLGDLAQATAPGSTQSWDHSVNVIEQHLGQVWAEGEPVTARQVELTVGYRVPAEILDVANRLLAEAAPKVTAPSSVRTGGDPPLVVQAEPDSVDTVIGNELDALASRFGSVAVVGLAPRLSSLETSLADSAVTLSRVGDAGRSLGDDGAVALITPQAVKGLEFDAVVVIEPAEIAGLEHGLRHLYVAMTRAVQHLGIVHVEPLPPLLGIDQTFL